MEAQFTPNLIASGTIRPFRGVTLDGTDNSVAESNANEFVVGVTDGSTKQFDSANHAESGDEVRLQTGLVVRVYANAAVNAGERLKTDAEGEFGPVATTGTTNQESAGVALEDGADGSLIRMYLCQQVIQPAPT